MKFIKIYLLPIFIFILGFLLRAQETLSNNFLFLIDQGRDMMAVKNIVFDHHLTLIGPYTSLQGVFQGPLYYYLLSIPTFILNGNPWGGVFLMLIISLCVMIVSFFWMKKLFGVKAATVTLFLVAICPAAVAAATYIWNPHPMWLLVTFFIFIFYEAQKDKKYHLFLWPIIALMFHFQTALAVFILLGSFLYFLIFERKNFRKKEFYYGLLISILFFLPQIIFELKHNFLMTKSVLILLMGKDQGLFTKGEHTNFLNLINSHPYEFYVNFNSSFLHEGIMQNIPLFLFIFLIFMLLFGRKIKVVSEKENNFIWILTRLVIILLFLMLIYPFPIRYWFLTGFEMFYIIPLGLLLSKLLNFAKSKLLLYLFFVLVIFYLKPVIYDLYFHPDYGGIAKIKGKSDAIDFIYKDANGKPFNLLVFTPPVYTFAYDYLIWWKAKEKYNYVPGNEKKGIFYLLIEPDSNQPWSYKGWEETVIKTGKVISTTQLSSGLIVEKRIQE